MPALEYELGGVVVAEHRVPTEKLFTIADFGQNCGVDGLAVQRLLPRNLGVAEPSAGRHGRIPDHAKQHLVPTDSLKAETTVPDHDVLGSRSDGHEAEGSHRLRIETQGLSQLK